MNNYIDRKINRILKVLELENAGEFSEPVKEAFRAQMDWLVGQNPASQNEQNFYNNSAELADIVMEQRKYLQK